MKRFVNFLAPAAVFVLAFGWGFALNFPDAAATRAIEASVNTSPVLAIGLEPIRFTLTGLRSDRLVVRRVGGSNDPPLLTLTDVRLPFRPTLFRGASLQAALGSDGRLNGFVAWDGSDITVDELSARLEDLSLPLGTPGMTVKGHVTLSGRLRPGPRPGNVRAELPDGELHGRVEALEVSGLNVAGTVLPVTHLQDVEIDLRMGRTVQIERIVAHGDLQGTAQGSVVPNLDRIQDSRLSLTVSAALRPGWIQDTGALRPILEGFFPGGRIEGTLGGTAGAPAWSGAGSRR